MKIQKGMLGRCCNQSKVVKNEVKISNVLHLLLRCLLQLQITLITRISKLRYRYIVNLHKNNLFRTITNDETLIYTKLCIIERLQNNMIQ